MGLFKPAYQSSNEQKALAALDKPLSTEILLDAIRTTPWVSVKIRALQNLKDRDEFIRLLHDDALQREESVFAVLVARAERYDVMRLWITHVDKPAEQRHFLPHLSDEDLKNQLRARIVKDEWKRSNNTTLAPEVGDLSDDTLLLEVMDELSSSFIDRCLPLLESKESILIELLEKDRGTHTTNRILSRISSQNQLEAIYWGTFKRVNSYTLSLRQETVKRLTSQDLLARVALREKVGEIGAAAVAGIRSQETLLKVAMDAASLPAKLAATGRIQAQEDLITLVLDSTSEEVRQSAVQWVTDKETLIMVVLTDPSRSVRQRAAEKIPDEETALYLFNESDDAALRACFIDKVESRDVLTQAAEHDEAGVVREAATKRLTFLKRRSQLEREVEAALNTGLDSSEQKRAFKSALELATLVGDCALPAELFQTHLPHFGHDNANFVYKLTKLLRTNPKALLSARGSVEAWTQHNHKDNILHTDVDHGRAPHVDSTQYYDFLRYPDGTTVPRAGGRSKHTDHPMIASDCAQYGHEDSKHHNDNGSRDILLRLPPPNTNE